MGTDHELRSLLTKVHQDMLSLLEVFRKLTSARPVFPKDPWGDYLNNVHTQASELATACYMAIRALSKDESGDEGP